MLKFQWNALRTGDKVLVHNPGSPELGLTPGVVVAIETHRGASRVGIRILVGGRESVVLWPSYLAVHRDPIDPKEPCWRCEELSGRAEKHRDIALERVAVGTG